MKKLEKGERMTTDDESVAKVDYYIANAELIPVEGGHFRVKFRVLHKETHQPGTQYNSVFILSFDGWGYCVGGGPRDDGWHDSVYTPAKPGPTWVKISTSGVCPITDEDQVRLVYPPAR